MDPQVTSMAVDKPDQRISMDDIVRELDKVVSKHPSWRLRTRLRRRDNSLFINSVKDLQHTFRTAIYIMLRRPAILITPPRLEFDGGSA